MPDRRQVLRLGAFTVAAPALSGVAISSLSGVAQASDHRKIVVGHRGAAGYRPEHTLASYELAARMGADYIEPDLVITKDGVLVARHEPEIGMTTDVASHPEFADRRRTVILDGISVTGWFTHDFTLAELKTLRATERIPGVRQRNTLYDGLFEVPTFDEVLALRARLSRELDREIGVFPETKHPTYFRELGLDLELRLVRELRSRGLDRAGARVIVQSFEARNLVELRRVHKVRVPLAFLTAVAGGPFGDPRSYSEYLTPAGLRELAKTIDTIGPDKSQVIPPGGSPTSLVADAHAAGLQVIPYTFRAENQYLPPQLRVGTDPTAYGRAIDEQVMFWHAGVDGLFTDQPDIGVLARETAFSGEPALV